MACRASPPPKYGAASAAGAVSAPPTVAAAAALARMAVNRETFPLPLRVELRLRARVNIETPFRGRPGLSAGRWQESPLGYANATVTLGMKDSALKRTRA